PTPAVHADLAAPALSGASPFPHPIGGRADHPKQVPINLFAASSAWMKHAGFPPRLEDKAMRSPHRSLSRVQGWFVVILSLAMPRVASAADGAWVNLNLSTHPGARSEFSAVYDPGRHRMVIFGGADSSDNAVTDVWALDLNGNCTPSWKQLKVTGTAPSYPSDYSAVYDTAFDRMVVFGGEHPGLND